MSRRPDADVPPGLLLVDKAGGMTSHDVVARARRVLSVRKVGHAGTLDPMATGLLVLGVGAATRLLGYVGGHDKTYEATIRLGQSTVTDDREGEVLTTASTVAPGRRRDPGRAGRADRAAAAGPVGGERGQGGRPPLLRPRARRRGGRARAPVGHRARARGAPDRPARRPTWSTSTSPSAAPPAPTSGPSPATPGRRSASAGTSPRCGAPPPDRSPSTARHRSRRPGPRCWPAGAAGSSA